MITRYQIYKLEQVTNGAQRHERAVKLIPIGSFEEGKMIIDTFYSYEEAKKCMVDIQSPHIRDEHYTILEVYTI